jgi:hypothetical protein
MGTGKTAGESTSGTGPNATPNAPARLAVAAYAEGDTQAESVAPWARPHVRSSA